MPTAIKPGPRLVRYAVLQPAAPLGGCLRGAPQQSHYRHAGVCSASAVAALTQVPEQFFPLSNRPEVIVDLWLPEGSSFEQTEAAAKRMEALLAKDEDVEHVASYIGSGTPRFFLLIVQQLANTNLAELVVMTKDNVARERVMQRVRQALATDFPAVRGRVMRLNVGPPMDYPVVFRVLGENPNIVRGIADRVAEVVRGQSQHRGRQRRLA